ncbi:MAG: Crp/Fnr family transcriptional regulator [Gammaproteobacteria bacterium]|jgi:CRP-like cAMP-binding protein
MIDDLKKGLLFAHLSDEQLQRVARGARHLRLGEGEPLFEQGGRAERFYLLLAGLIKLYRLSPAGNEKVIEVVTPGSTFAEALMFLDHPHYPVGAAALSDAELISVDAHDFAAMLRESVDTCFLLLGDMSQRLRGLLREIDDLSLHSATCRVAGYLLSQAPEDNSEFELNVPKQILASRLSVKPETFSRIIRNLTERGYITVAGNRVRIEKRDAMHDVADVCALPQDALQSTFMYPSPPTGR